MNLSSQFFIFLIFFLILLFADQFLSLSEASINEQKIMKEMAQRSETNKSKIINNTSILNAKKMKWLRDYKKLTENQLYSKIIESFHEKNKISLEVGSELMLKKYPRSAYADNSVYLSALSDLEKDLFVNALEKLNIVIKDYPYGNKRVSALFAKAITYKKLNLLDQSQWVLKQLMNEYPGSPESQRAVVELKLLNLNSSRLQVK